MELGNVYEVFRIGDIVKVNDGGSIYCGQIGVIVSIDNPGCYVDPIYTIRFDEPSLWSCTDRSEPRETRVNAKHLVKAGHVTHEDEITMRLRNGKTYLTQIGRCKNKDNGFDSIIYQMEKKRKVTEGGNSMKKIDVEKIIFNGFKTIVFWNDGTKTIVSMSQEERDFDPEDAFRAAYTKKMYGTNSKIKRIIKEKSNIEQHQRIAKEKLKEEMEKISRDYDKYMKENYPWMYRDEEKKEKSEAPVRHKFKVGDGVVIASIRSPYFGRGGTITAIAQSYVDGSLQYTVEFYHPGNPGYSYTYAFPECQLAYDPAQALTEKGKKAADAWSVLWDMFFDCGDDNKEKKDDEN